VVLNRYIAGINNPRITWLMEMSAADAPAKIKHPKELYRLSNVMSWHYFSYYGANALLIAYVVTQLHFSDTMGYAIYGTFAALAWGFPLFGGVIADKLLGKRRSMIWGIVLQTIGLGLTAVPNTTAFFIGLAFFVIGNGFVNGIYKALLGDFYGKEDVKGKDAGFTIIYGLFNVGVALGGIACGFAGQEINWQLGFGIAALASLVSLVSMIFGIDKKYGLPPAVASQRLVWGITTEWAVYLLCMPAVALIALIFLYPGVMDTVLFPLAIVSFGYVIYLSFKYTRAERLKLFAALMAFLIYALFLALYEQSGGSMNLFVIRNVNMKVGGVTMSGLAVNNFLPGFLPAIIMPLMLYVWRKLDKSNHEPGTIMKFVIGLLFMGAFFGVLWWGCRLYSHTGLVPVYFLVAGYVLMEFSEMCIGPNMYCLAYKLSPGQIAGTMMGVLGIAASLGEYLAAKIGGLMVVPTGLTDPIKTLHYYTTILGELALLSLGAALLIVFLLPAFKRLMQDVA
jgi:POT family proton-dependent oligopeptide transporter